MMIIKPKPHDSAQRVLLHPEREGMHYSDSAVLEWNKARWWRR